MDSIFWFLHGKDYNQIKEKLKQEKLENLHNVIINERYNNFLSRYADFEENEEPINSKIENGKHNNKRIPYQGWFWRNLDFANGLIPIGFGDGYIGFMANNKWDYHERYLTNDEFEKLMIIIDKAMRIAEEGGDMKELYKRKMEQIEKIYPFIASLPRLVRG